MVRLDIEWAIPPPEMNMNSVRCGLAQVNWARTHTPPKAKSTQEPVFRLWTDQACWSTGLGTSSRSGISGAA